jgi:catechol 2,3-dioxygenase
MADPPTLPSTTALGPVRLTVADTVGARVFYERVIGLRALDGGVADDEGVVRLGAGPGGGGEPLVELVGRADAPARAHGSSGLFHLAVLVPDRPSLAQALRRVVAGRWGIDGASDHLVSEALYLSDPEGNGIELYRDRPREQWRRENGELAMATLPLDLQDLASELHGADAPDAGMPEGTRIGHVHLQVGDLAAAEAFYADVLGFDVVVRGYPGALFISTGGYHHHVGLNTWASAGGAPAVAGARGLRDFAVLLPNAEERDRVAARAGAAGFATRSDDATGDAVVTDPFGIDVRLRAG